MKFTKSLIKTAMAMMLAMAIAFTCVPVNAQAANVSSKLNTKAKVGKTYSIKSYIPGIGFQKINVKFASAKTKSFYNSYGVKVNQTDVTMKVSVPKSTLNKIKGNVTKVCQSSKYGQKGLFGTPVAIDAKTGKNLIMDANGNNAFYQMKTSGLKKKTYTQNNYHYTVASSFTAKMSVYYTDNYAGRILVGYAGVKKDTSNEDAALASFAKGKKSITGTTLYKNKMKSLSIWKKF